MSPREALVAIQPHSNRILLFLWRRRNQQYFVRRVRGFQHPNQLINETLNLSFLCDSSASQRLARARAFVRQADLVILDEPTSAMDSWAEAAWMGRFRELVAGRTTLIITHRLNHGHAGGCDPHDGRRPHR